MSRSMHTRERSWVASFAEAWIEIGMLGGSGRLHNVASFAEAWIEISSSVQASRYLTAKTL